jgi:hypothetical protein
VGKAAKCPRCGVKFRIPTTDDLGEQSPANPDSDVAHAELSDSGVGSSPGQAARPAQKEPQIEFLCPNGHHLHGPASLQGRPGACPECGSRFRIPILEEAAEEAESDHLSIDSVVGVGEAAGDAAQHPEATLAEIDGEAVESHDTLPAVYEMPSNVYQGPASAQEAASSTQIKLREPGSSSVAAKPAGEAAAGHPLGEIIAKLWAAKDDDAKFELQLKGGEILTPDYFAAKLSRHSHGVFAGKGADGNWTVTVVPWDSVERVLLRGVKTLPGEIA